MNSRACTTPPTRPRAAAAALVFATALLSGCSSAMVEDRLPVAAGGLPDNAPQRPAAEVAYPAVHNMPPARATTPLSYDQQKKLEDDLIAARSKYGKNDTPAATGSTDNGSTNNGSANSGSSANGKAGSVQNP